LRVLPGWICAFARSGSLTSRSPTPHWEAAKEKSSARHIESRVAQTACDVARRKHCRGGRLSVRTSTQTENWTPSRFRRSHEHAKSTDFPGPLIGETGFEPAAARPPAREIRCRGVLNPRFTGFSTRRVPPSWSQIGPQIGPQAYVRLGGWLGHRGQHTSTRARSLGGDRRTSLRTVSAFVLNGHSGVPMMADLGCSSSRDCESPRLDVSLLLFLSSG
jgi:hypothetical protein